MISSSTTIITMDINQNQQINSFLKGMNTDTSDALLSTDQYRFARNVRVVTNTDANSGELRIVDGNTTILELDVEQSTILSMDSIRNVVVLIVQEIVQENEQWSVYRYKQGEDDAFVKVYTCTDKPICSAKGKQLSTVLRWESENNIKLYIANGNDPIISLQVNKTYEDGEGNYPSYADMFKYNNINLPAPKISNIKNGGSIPSAIVQYAYRLYKENGGATTMSALSEPVSLYRDAYHGFAPNKNTNKAIELNIGEITSSQLNKIQVYRIIYQQNGQIPVVTLIADQKLISSIITDYGNQSIEEVDASEFLSLYNTIIYPKVIESKGDYLFLAANKYAQDDADKTFEHIDARCYSLGNYIVQNGQNVCPIQINNDVITILDGIEDEDLKHHSYENGQHQTAWSSEYFGEIGNSGYNGIGKYFKWKYILTDEHAINPKNQEGSRTYRRGEVYRFGVRLFDYEGNASSVKWMCDITMPPMFTGDYTGIKVNNGTIIVQELGIQFETVNPQNDPEWEKVAGYEIVQCKRGISDSYVITQGIGGKTHCMFKDGDVDAQSMFEPNAQSNLITPSGFFTMNNVTVNGSWLDSSISGGVAYPQHHAIPSDSIMMFSSPEYVYQADDIKNVMDMYKTNATIENVVAYKPKSTESTTFEGTMNFEGQAGERVNLFGNSGVTSLGIKTQEVQDNAPAYYLGFSDSNDVFDGYYIDKIVQIYNAPFGVFTSPSGAGEITYYGTNVSSALPVRQDTFYSDHNGRKTYHYFNYFYPESISQSITQDEQQQGPRIYEIDDVAYANSPSYSDFAKDGEFTFKNNVTAIGNKTFINWTTPTLAGILDKANIEYLNATKEVIKSPMGDVPYVNDNDDDTIAKSDFFYPIGSGGKCMLISTKNINSDVYVYDKQHAPYIHVQNITKPATPYGGYNYSAILGSTYLSVGGYANAGESVQLFAGDTFIKMFTFNAAHEWSDPTFRWIVKMGTVYSVPVETSIDLHAQFGTSLYNVDQLSIYVQDKASAFDSYTQSTDAYAYNTAYSTTSNIQTWYPNLTTEGSTNNYDTRVHFSERKINNEKIDNWLQYKAMNFKDVDSRYGQITSMKLFNDKLIFWQEHATGVLSVNERILINDINDTQLQLGTGGVLERYDYFSTVYGMKKNQHARANSNGALYWWDGNNKEILQYSQAIIPLSTTKYIKNYINEGEESELPTILYNPKYKEVVCNVVNNESVVYSEQVDAFTSVYDENVQFWCNVLGDIYEAVRGNDHIYKQNESQNVVTVFGDMVTPSIKYVVNKDPQYVKTFDMQTFGGRFYGGELDALNNLQFDYKTPLKQHSAINGGEDQDGRRMTNVEYDFRITIPRDGTDAQNKPKYGNRMRGKTMQCEFKSSSNNKDFSLQYIITKFRMSWT